MKKFFIALSLAALLSVTNVFAQELSKKDKFYQVVPRHEFFFEGFGGFAPLGYSVTAYNIPEPTTMATEGPVGTTRNSSLWPWQAAQWMDKEHFKQFPVGIGYGGGFGYIYHFHRVWGFMTGIEAAVYNGGIDLTGDKDNLIWTAGVAGDNRLRVLGLKNYTETQQYIALQVPLMMHIMAPMGKGNHHFYFAFGGKFGVNLWGKFQGNCETAFAAEIPYSDSWKEYTANDYPLGIISGFGKDVRPYGIDGYAETIIGDEIDGEFSEKGLSGKGFFPFKKNLYNAMASIELGFRWKLGGGCGLYTGLYADLGLLPLNLFHGGTAIKQTEEGGEETQSILVSGGLPTYSFKEGETADAPGKYMNRPLPAATSFVHSLHTGLKMKIAFGKVRKAPVPVILPPKPDTVVKTVVQTVVVRDTVTRQNTVVVRDTVEKVKVVRDTVIVIKEVPQEIKDVMVELSNTLFAFNKFNLTDKAKAGLDKVAAWLNDNPDVQVEISGHTDSVGSDSYNQKLSEDRAKSVYEYFIHEGGVSSKRLSYKGYGKTRPIATNETDAGRQQNRRVELNIIQ